MLRIATNSPVDCYLVGDPIRGSPEGWHKAALFLYFLKIGSFSSSGSKTCSKSPVQMPHTTE